MASTHSRFRRVTVSADAERSVVSKIDIALDRLNRGVAMPSVRRLLQEIENLDDTVRDQQTAPEE